MAQMDYIDLAVRCLSKAVKLNPSIPSIHTCAISQLPEPMLT